MPAVCAASLRHCLQVCFGLMLHSEIDIVAYALPENVYFIQCLEFYCVIPVLSIDFRGL
jgi:hypothetical protein